MTRLSLQQRTLDGLLERVTLALEQSNTTQQKTLEVSQKQTETLAKLQSTQEKL